MKNWRLWGGILISLLCLYWVAKGIDWRSLRAELGQTQLVWLLPAFAILVGSMWARALRWRLLLQSVPGLRTGRLFNLLNISYLVNNVSPFRLGDLLRAYLCAELHRLSMAQALSTVVIERVADTLTIVFLLLVLLPTVSFPTPVVRSMFGVGLAALAAACMLVFFALRREWSLALLDRVSTRLRFLARTPLRRLLASAVDGLTALGSWRTVLGVLTWSCVIWVGTGLQFFVVMRAARMRLPFAAALAVLCLTSLGMVVPSSPGYVGVFEYITVVALALFAVSREAALGYALILHALSYASLAILGVAALWSEGYSYARLRAVLNQAADGQSTMRDQRSR
jgi:uncharacterized protein (TIRG00374 family)